jgi:hypothetical protein
VKWSGAEFKSRPKRNTKEAFKPEERNGINDEA